MAKTKYTQDPVATCSFGILNTRAILVWALKSFKILRSVLQSSMTSVERDVSDGAGACSDVFTIISCCLCKYKSA